MLQITNIEKSREKQVLFDSVDFTVNPREQVWLVGRKPRQNHRLFTAFWNTTCSAKEGRGLPVKACRPL